MSFNTALSGLNAAQADLNVISNDIANVNTTGFKESRAEFGDIFATSSLGSGSTAIGSGVILSKVGQQFNQGNLDFTSSSLDLAISGDGFFVLSPNLTSQENVFSRAGAFGVDDNGYVVNSAGQFLKVFQVNADGSVSASALSSTIPLQLPAESGSPTQTSEIEIGVNLSASGTELDPANFDQTNPTTYTHSTSAQIIDSLGENHVITFYYIKDVNNSNTWAQYLTLDGAPLDVAGGTPGAAGQLYGEIVYDNAGNFANTNPSPVTTAALGFTSGADATQTITIDYASNDPTQFAAGFAVSTLAQDGFATGQLSGIDISDEGVI
ncbi:MAG: flagellar hook protein FlgE, partial [Enterobacterales bacterium]|nr:flagellar hook protein FlgE [Enterobacterales bacterium]